MARSSDDVGDRALSFWEAHRALASAYETDLAQLQDQKVQLQIPRQASTSLLDLDACLRRDSSALRGGATPPSASMSMSPSVQRTSIRRNSFEECSVSARPSLMSMMLDGFLVEEQKARALGLQMRQRLEPRAGAESSLKLMHALSHHSDSQSEEMEDCLEPRICWQQDVSFPPRKLSATATASIAVPDKSQRVWMLSPASRARVRWDLLAVLMVLVELLVFPAQVFSDTWPQQVWPEFALLSLTFWSCDISLNFLTGFHSGGELVLNASDIAKKYLRGWFFFDLLFVASDLAALCAGLGSAPRELWVALRSAQLVLRLGRLMQLGKMTECLKRRLVNDVSIAKLDIGLIVMQIFTTQHLVACAWYDLGIMNERGWVTHWQLQGRSKEFQYLTALHWTYCQLGFGGTEIEPSTAAERIFGLLVAFMALGIFSTLLGSVTGLSGLLNKSSEEKRFLFVTLRRFLEHNRIHEDLKERITCFLEHAYSLNKKNMTEDQVQLLELLSVPLHRELQRARYDFSLKELGLLRNSLGRRRRGCS
ncbi:unnamed protein product [Effrenium voratum]|nr:unnamed protein product [Effrenium voratum]